MDHPSDIPDDMGGGDVSVALDTLAADDGTAPAVGDEVDVAVKGTVSRIDEATNCAYVTPTECNGQPPPHMGDEAESGDSLKDQAYQADSADQNQYA
jgi:hypothetical protein